MIFWCVCVCVWGGGGGEGSKKVCGALLQELRLWGNSRVSPPLYETLVALLTFFACTVDC